MGFTTPCFVRKNNAKMRKRLEKLGYNVLFSARNECSNTLIAIKGNIHAQIVPCDVDNSYIDCGENETLFYFLAALRDDCDSNQLFVNGKGDWGIWRDDALSGIEWWYLPNDNNIENYHKATKKEIIELFKKR